MNRIQYLHYWIWQVKLRSVEARFGFFVCAFLASLVISGIISYFVKNDMVLAWTVVAWAGAAVLYFMLWCAGTAWGAVQEFNRAYDKHREKTFNILKE